MKPYLLKLLETFVKDEYDLEEIKMEIILVEAKGKRSNIDELLKHASTEEE